MKRKPQQPPMPHGGEPGPSLNWMRWFDLVSEWPNAGGTRILPPGAKCAKCGKPFAGEKTYRLRIFKTEAMPVPSYTYFCTACPLPKTKGAT